MQHGHLSGWNLQRFRDKLIFCYILFIQLRLDFNTFAITGPNTFTTTAVLGANGAATVAAGKSFSYATQCLTDTFSVTGYSSSPPVICGTNTGTHSNANPYFKPKKGIFLNISFIFSVC